MSITGVHPENTNCDAPPPVPLWLSILIPVYNVEAYLRECVESVLNQTDDPGIEIILLDDCSTDGSRALCEQLSREHPVRIKALHHRENAGVSVTRNHLLDAARGDYIWFIDSDDYLLPDVIGRLRSIIVHHEPDIISCDYSKRGLVRQRDRHKRTFPGAGRAFSRNIGDLVRGVFRYRKMYLWVRITRRSLWGSDLRFPAGRLFEDIATTPWLLLRAKSHYYVPEPWLYYRVTPGSIMTTVSRTPGYFDVKKHDDMAQALTGFREALVEHLGADRELMFAVSHFIAQEFRKSARRFRIWSRKMPATDASFTPFYEKMEQCSPLDFDTMTHLYLRRLWLFHAFVLHRAVRFARKERLRER
jgi:glycosyltransferase involved in cell wall biosynthesis